MHKGIESCRKALACHAAQGESNRGREDRRERQGFRGSATHSSSTYARSAAHDSPDRAWHTSLEDQRERLQPETARAERLRGCP
jgi:hypothetical protein